MFGADCTFCLPKNQQVCATKYLCLLINRSKPDKINLITHNFCRSAFFNKIIFILTRTNCLYIYSTNTYICCGTNITRITCKIPALFAQKQKKQPIWLLVNKKMASTSHHAAQPITLAVFRPWGDSSGAGCVRLAAAKVRRFIELRKFFEQKKRFLDKRIET
jgi:hypothetical protein